MPTETIQELKAELDNGTKPYSIDIKPRVTGTPVLEIVMEAIGNQTYHFDFEHATDVSDNRTFITPELVNTSPVLLVAFDEDAQGFIKSECVGVKLIYDTFQREQEHGDPQTVAEYYSIGEEYRNDTQQPAWHLTHRVDRDEPFVYAFV